MPIWLCLHGPRKALGVPPKCGTRSVLAALREQIGYTGSIEEAGQHISRVDFQRIPDGDYELFFVVRDPLARWASCWKNKCRDRHGGIARTHECIRGMSAKEFADYVLAGHRNNHWRPQADMLPPGRMVNLVSHEHLSSWWQRQPWLTTELPHKNASEGANPRVGLRRIQALQELYSRDMVLCALAGSGCAVEVDQARSAISIWPASAGGNRGAGPVARQSWSEIVARDRKFRGVFDALLAGKHPDPGKSDRN